MSELTAIDILLNPDRSMLDLARALNERLRALYPEGFALDASHIPHVTTLQRYVHTADLGEVFRVIDRLVMHAHLGELELRSTAISHVAWGGPGIGLASIEIAHTAALVAWQAELLDGVSAYVGSGGTATAYYTDPDDSEISSDTLRYVETYVPEHSGQNYSSHLSVGFARTADLERIEGEPFEPLHFHAVGLSAFQLGEGGAARKELKSWPL
jgi:hypothetical protein